MTRRLRLVLLTRRFWPLVGGAEMVMANLAAEFHRRSLPTTVLTARWEEHWPPEVVHREVPVYRLPQPKQRMWGTWRYMVAISRWLRQRPRSFDAVLVSMLKHDAYAALRTLQPAGVPVVIRAEGAGATGDCHWQQTARFGRRIQKLCQQAPAIIAPSSAVESELLAAGYDAGQVHLIPNGVALPRKRVPRSVARQALAESNRDLEAGHQVPVAVYTGRMDRAKGLADLVRAWPRVRAEFPQARLWLIGDGPFREELFQLVKDLEQRGYILLPGSFDDVSDVLHAANVFVLPSYAEGLSLALLEAMAHGVPVVATDIPGNRTVLDDRNGLLVKPREPAGLAEAILQVFRLPSEAVHRAERAAHLVAERYSLARMADDHLAIVQQLLETRSPPKP